MIEALVAYTDGGSRGNPGKAACAVFYPQSGESEGKFLGIGTNNEAEYEGLIMALERATQHGHKHLKVYMDSELVVRQITGRYRVNNVQLLEKKLKADLLIERLDKFEIQHVRREFNKEADAEVNRIFAEN
jgi:ribonuclease HI